ncbi:pentapeptide repeat-containing protein, partial [Mycobacterium bourgelatii]
FNAGSTNTGDFNPGNINTGWFNTGHSNTGIANSGDVGTGALMSANYSNGIFGRGDYQGLLHYTYDYPLPKIPFLDIQASASFGPVVVPPIPIPAINVHLDGSVSLGEFFIEPIDIPALNPDIMGSIGFGPIHLPSVRIPGIDGLSVVMHADPVRAPDTSVGPFIIWTSDGVGGAPTYYTIGQTYEEPPAGMPGFATGDLYTLGGLVGQTHSVLTVITQGFDTPEINIGRIQLGFHVPVFIDPFTIFPDGLQFSPMDLVNFHVHAGTLAVDIPAITIPQIVANAGGSAYVIPSDIRLIHFPATPGIGNTSTTPSSGFFNSGAGGGSGWGNVGTGMSGWWNQASSALLGTSSGYFNVGALGSGVLNWGSGLSGFYNTSALGVETPALVSGLGNFGHQVSGLLAAGSALNQSAIINIGLADVGNGNL